MKIYKASAGSGKTYTLAKEYIKELLLKDSDWNFRHILAVTFTKDATGEMKDRILAELYGLTFNTDDSQGFLDAVQEALQASGKYMSETLIREKSGRILDAILHDYSRLYITTIDSFFQKILRSLARELGTGSKFNIEMNTAKVRLEAVGSMIENAHRDKQLLQWLTTYVENKLEQNGNWHFKDEVFRFSSCIYDEFFQEHEQLLKKQLDSNHAVFSELKNHHGKLLGIYKADFRHTYQKAMDLSAEASLSPEDFYNKGFVFKFWEKLSETQEGEVKSTIISHLENPEAWATKSNKRREEIIALAENHLRTLLQETVETLKKYNTSKLILQNIHQLGLVWYITKEIDAANLENNRFMLSDTAQFLNRMIDNSDAPFIYEKIGAEIRHILIDEFQDTSRLQWNNFKTLLLDILSERQFSLIVGDIKQSIYRWRNGDWRILNNIGKELSVLPETLPYNFRSEIQVVTFNNAFFTQVGQVLNEKYKNELISLSNSPFASVYCAEEVTQETLKKEGSGYVSIDFLQDTDEKKYKDIVPEIVVEKLNALLEAGIPARKICILVRKNNEIAELAGYFSSMKADFPDLAKGNYLNIVSDEAFSLSSSEAVKMIMGALKAIAYPEKQAFYTLSLQAEGSDKSQSLINIPSLSYMPLLELISYFYRFYELNKLAGQSAYLFSFFDAVMTYLKDNPGDIQAFINYWDEELSRKTIPAGEGIDGIRAMTIHKSKGLQFHTVLIPYCTWDLNPKRNTIVWCKPKPGVYDLELLPVGFSEKMNGTVFSEEYEHEMSLSWLDNLNLVYVAFTRAEHNLIVFGKYKKNLSGTENIKNTSDLLQWTIPELDGEWDARSLHYDFGKLQKFEEKTSETTDNILKQHPLPKYVEFVSENFQEGKSIFKQSNKSREFVDPNAQSKEKYVKHGNIMHALFEKIYTFDDLEKAVDNLISEGLILPADRIMYIDKLRSAITNSDVADWFSDKYKVYSEFSILLEEEGEVTSKRPDRVLLSEHETIIVDYKFGEPHAAHKKQMRQYIDLLQTMRYPQVKGYLWYVENDNKIIAC